MEYVVVAVSECAVSIYRWKKSTCVGVYCVLALLYIMQLATLILYCFDSEDRNLDIDVRRWWRCRLQMQYFTLFYVKHILTAVFRQT